MKFEVFRTKAGRYRWRMRESDGSIVKVRPGRIHLPHDPEADRRSRNAVQEVLRQRYEAARAAEA